MSATSTIAAVSAVLAGLGAGGGEGNWGQFRGPGGRGIAPDAAPLPTVLDPAKNLAWKVEVGPGHSSPCIWGDRIFLTASDGNELETLCIDRTSGDVRWRRAVHAEQLERIHPINSPAAPTPATDGERVFVYFGAFGLIAYDLEGEELWRRELPIAENTFGTATSPIVAEGLLIFVRDTNTASYLEAIDPESGETVWHRDREGFKSGWSTPVLWRHGDVDELIVYGIWWLSAYDLADGSERWSVPGLADEPIITPVTGDGMVFVTSYNMNRSPEVAGLPQYASLLEELDTDGDGAISFQEGEANKSVLSRNDADGEGDHPLRIFYRFLDEDRDQKISESEYQKLFEWLGGFEQANAIMGIRPGDGERKTEIVWQHGRGVPECPSPLYYEGRLYLVKNGGIATCLDARTGAVHFEERLDSRGPVYSSPVAGDGKVYSASAHGVVTVFAAGDTLNVLARNDLGERIMATPALLDGKVYVRTEAHLFAFGPER